MNEEDFDVDNFIAHAVEEINKDWYFHSIRSSDSQRCFFIMKSENTRNKANEFFDSISIEDYEREVADNIRKLEQENRRKLELFDAETKEIVEKCINSDKNTFF